MVFFLGVSTRSLGIALPPRWASYHSLEEHSAAKAFAQHFSLPAAAFSSFSCSLCLCLLSLEVANISKGEFWVCFSAVLSGILPPQPDHISSFEYHSVSSAQWNCRLLYFLPCELGWGEYELTGCGCLVICVSPLPVLSNDHTMCFNHLCRMLSAGALAQYKLLCYGCNQKSSSGAGVVA